MKLLACSKELHCFVDPPQLDTCDLRKSSELIIRELKWDRADWPSIDLGE
jgi:hypothetical protein